MLLPHRGRHTHGYHRWVVEGMEDAHRSARGDLDTFLREYQRNVIDPVVADPGILYR